MTRRSDAAEPPISTTPTWRRLAALPPTLEPRATDHIGEMIAMIERLIETGHAYVAEGHVLFDVALRSPTTASCQAAPPTR